MYEHIYGLSCIENHVLAVLKQCGEKVEFLYHNCAVPIYKLYSLLVRKGIKQENFAEVQRVQDILKKLGIISLVKKQPESIENLKDLREEIQKCQRNEYILTRVKPEFSKTVLYSRGLRTDHYVLIKSEGNDFKLYNDIPERILTVTERQLPEIFDGDYFKMSVLRELNVDDANYLWLNRDYKPENQNSFDFNKNHFNEIDEIGIKLRNMVGIYKTLSRRMAEYYGIYINTDFIRGILPNVDKLYALLEYYNLKQNTPLEKYYSVISEFVNIDGILLKQLQTQIGENSDVKEKNKRYFNGSGIS